MNESHHHRNSSPLIGGLYFAIWRRIAFFCQFPELCNLAFANTILHEVCDHPPIWNEFVTLRNLFPTLLPENNSDNDENDEKNQQQQRDKNTYQKLHEKAKNLGILDHPLTVNFFVELLSISKSSKSIDDKSSLKSEDLPVSFVTFFSKTHHHKIISNLAKKYFKQCSPQLELLLYVHLSRFLPLHCLCFAAVADDDDESRSTVRVFFQKNFKLCTELQKLMFQGSRGPLREMMTDILSLTLTSNNYFTIWSFYEQQTDFGNALMMPEFSSHNHKQLTNERLLMRRLMVNDGNFVSSSPNFVIAKQFLNCLPMKVACLNIRNSLLRHTEFVAALDEVTSGVFTHYFFVTYSSTAFCALGLFTFSLIIFFLVNPSSPIPSNHQGSLQHDSNKDWSPNLLSLEILLFLIPHLSLISKGGGYFGVYYSMKRQHWGRRVLLLILNNLVRPFIFTLASFLGIGIALVLLSVVPFDSVAVSLFVFVICLFFMSSATAKEKLKVGLRPLVRFVMVTLFSWEIGNQVFDNVASRVTTIFLSFLANKAIRFLLTTFVIIFLSVSYYPPTWTFFVSFTENLGWYLFAAHQRKMHHSVSSIPEQIFRSGGFCLFRFSCSVLFSVILYFIQDGRDSTLEGNNNKDSSTLKRHLFTIACAFASIRMEHILLRNAEQQQLGNDQREVYANYFFLIQLVSKCVVGLISDLYRCFFCSSSYDHEVFKLSSSFSAKLKFVGDDDDKIKKEDSLFLERMKM